QILEAIRLMPTIERIEIVEFTLRLMRADIKRDSDLQPAKKLSLAAAAEVMHDFYAEGSNLAKSSVRASVPKGNRSPDDFYEYEDYAILN
ncbi:hypothetical protein, partial [Chamaesiphon sp. VAR_48_metabat_403]|uniref:hypothetical protein n=1 Tax=Chamaesiphon sp. VAR_48_metabat_403 TaxID=2964700 RepID=UPI00286E20E6